MNLDRRSLLQGITAAGASLTFAGYAGAAGSRQYVVGGSESRLERRGFAVEQVLAGGEVFVVSGPEGATTDIEAIGGVQSAAPNVRFELEGAERAEPLEDVGEGVEGDWYENLWDKQHSEVVAANDVATGDGASIGIIDTGIDYAHPDLILSSPDAPPRTGEGRSRSVTVVEAPPTVAFDVRVRAGTDPEPIRVVAELPADRPIRRPPRRWLPREPRSRRRCRSR